ncbi:hypothetical protein FRC10_010057 [Ceratobasidium sp. 414]|nr:hypothetical protein FRC10_010057 [Ceratobasidium sp. 414]
MPNRDHVPSRPTFSLQPSREQPSTNSMGASTKRKSPASSEPTSEHNKRTRGLSAARSNASNLSSVSVPETVLESEYEFVVPPARTPLNWSFAEEPATPTPNVRSADMATPQVDEQSPAPPPPPTTPSKTGQETLDAAPRSSGVTPFKLSSSNTDPACVNPSESWSQTHRHPNAPTTPPRTQRSSQTIESNKTTRVGEAEMGEILKHELCGQVFLHKKFFDEFLPLGEAIHTEVRDRIVSSGALQPGSLLGFTGDRWTIHESISQQRNERLVYGPLADLLNVIGQGAYETYQRLHQGEQFRQHYRPFYNHSSSTALWDSPSDAATSPDLVMTRDQKRAHWGDMELLIECKSSSEKKHRNQAYLQLARYARTAFAHQIYRLHVFGFSLCGSIVNFVCFDRSGLLHSSDIDLSTAGGADSFVRHLISLLTIGPEEFGYDTRFSFRQNNEQNTVETLFKFEDHEPQVVSELLCYRKCCCGRATCVCALGDDVYKAIWRPDDRPDEGETLSIFEAVFGVCQVKAFVHGKYDTRLKHGDALETSPSSSFFRPSKASASRIVAGPSHSSIPSKSASRNASAQRPSADPPASDVPAVSGPAPVASIPRGVRIKSDILMPRGASLFDAQSSLHLLMAIHDALMGVMAFTQARKIHCDISAYNLLLINPEKHYGERGWLGAPKLPLKPDVWSQTASGPSSASNGATPNAETSTDACVCPRLKRAEEVNRGPVCVVHDTEFTVNEDRTKGDVHTDRTGTPAFISAQLLEGISSGQEPITRSFIHDIESLLWVLIWVVARRSQVKDHWKINTTAEDVIRKLSQNDLRSLGEYKRNLLADRARLEEKIDDLENDWSEDLAGVIGELADYIYTYLYFRPPKSTRLRTAPDFRVKQMQLHETYMAQSRSDTFATLFGILDVTIAELQARCSIIDFSKL